MTNNLKEENDVVELATEYEKNRNNVLYKAMMDVIVRANKGLFEEVKEKDMCDAIRELFHDEIEEVITKVDEHNYIIDATIPIQDLNRELDLEIEKEELENGETREVMKFIPYLAPYKVCVLPLVKKYHSEKAEEVYRTLSKYFPTSYDESGSIGKRYRRCDAIGTPFAITVDDETIKLKYKLVFFSITPITTPSLITL